MVNQYNDLSSRPMEKKRVCSLRCYCRLPTELRGERDPVSKKCCKSYKAGKACKKCPRFCDWNYLMSWKPVQPEPGSAKREMPANFLPSSETRCMEWNS